MKYILESLLQIFVIFMMVVFAIGCILAITGAFDHWAERYNLKRRRRRLLNGNLSKKASDIKAGDTQYYSTEPDDDSITP
jgi:hypothetical protein